MLLTYLTNWRPCYPVRVGAVTQSNEDLFEVLAAHATPKAGKNSSSKTATATAHNCHEQQGQLFDLWQEECPCPRARQRVRCTYVKSLPKNLTDRLQCKTPYNNNSRFQTSEFALNWNSTTAWCQYGPWASHSLTLLLIGAQRRRVTLAWKTGVNKASVGNGEFHPWCLEWLGGPRMTTR